MKKKNELIPFTVFEHGAGCRTEYECIRVKRPCGHLSCFFVRVRLNSKFKFNVMQVLIFILLC